MVEKAVESFEAQDMRDQRIRMAVRAGMVLVLNTGFPEGKILFYPQHQMAITMPQPGATFQVPESTARWLVQMFGKHLQLVNKNQLPANFTPPPGYKLVPVDPAQTVLPVPSDEDLLVNPEVNDEE